MTIESETIRFQCMSILFVRCLLSWYLNLWKQWKQKLVIIMGLSMPDLHLRKAVPTQHSTQNTFSDDKPRYFEEPSMSTFALVTFMSRWADTSSQGGKKKSMMINISGMLYRNLFLHGTSRGRLTNFRLLWIVALSSGADCPLLVVTAFGSGVFFSFGC